MTGILYIVPTPIGNLEDITLRALRVLREVDLIACEDTRYTTRLLNHYDIHKPLTSYYSYNQIKKTEYLISLLKEGKKIALVSDSGTPGISDPGYVIINNAVREDIEVVSLPGPCAAICGIVISGLPTDGFIFGGFLPRKIGKIKKVLLKYAEIGKTIIFYESPKRIEKTLGIILMAMPSCDIALVRELTKKYETVIRGKIEEVIKKISSMPIKGEIMIFIYPVGENI